MKNALGKILLLLAFSFSDAKDFDYNIQVNKSHPYVKEAIILTFDVNQTNHDIVLLFDFDILKDPSYEAQRIDIQEQDKYHDVSIRYTYLVYPLRSGEINIAFRLLQKATTDESVAYSFSGDRDNIKTLETKDSHIKVPPLKLLVKVIPKHTELVGNFTLDYDTPKHTAQAYEPFPIHIRIKGVGYAPILEHILPKNTPFSQFYQHPINQSSTSKKGTKNLVTYSMALSHDKNFSLEKLEIFAFDPLLEKSYTLTFPKQDFIIQDINTSTLVDSIDFPKKAEIDWQSLINILKYLIIFALGYFFAVFQEKLNWQQISIQKTLKKKHPLHKKIIACKNHKALLQLLMAQNHQKFSSIIEKLESVCYQNKDIPLNTLKKDAEEKINA